MFEMYFYNEWVYGARHFHRRYLGIMLNVLSFNSHMVRFFYIFFNSKVMLIWMIERVFM